MTLVLASRCVDGVIVNAENDTGQNYRLLMLQIGLQELLDNAP
jgi:hypothetical protein